MSEVQSGISINLRYADATEALREAMAAEGISTREPINPDGRIHRVYVEGDRRGTRNGWYVLHAGRIAAGAFGSWRLGVTKTWSGAQLHHTGVEARGTLQEWLFEAESGNPGGMQSEQCSPCCVSPAKKGQGSKRD
jgi:putative DNA primase/helicase